MCPCYSIFFLHFLLFSIPILHCSASEFLEEGFSLADVADNNTLVSSNNKFELGFFASNNDRRYLGIWYKYSKLYNGSTPKLIVWVANRDKPLMEPRGSLVIKDGTALLLDRKNESYWSTHVDVSSEQPVTNRSTFICLTDEGNLVLKVSKRGNVIDTTLWQSFYHPTDTFLPGMDITQVMVNLTSWRTHNDPACGNYKFLFDILANNKNKMFIMEKGSLHYWQSDVTPFDPAPQRLIDLLLNNLSENYSDTRLVMKFTGQLQFWEQKNGGWSLSWSAPKDSCDLLNRCGYYGSCNSNYGLQCNCLPGFIPSLPKRWNSGNFSEGCLPKSAICSRTYSEDKFLRMPMMKVSTPDGNDTNGASCRSTCLDDCNCKAYSCGAADCTGTSNMCLVWNKDFTNLQEEYAKGLTIFVRTTSPDIASTSRDCFPCGTHTIPYPLSTKADCGDPSYFNFHCNEETGQVSFSAFNGTFNVTAINPEARSFSIHVRHGNGCDVRSLDSVVLSPQESIPYSIKNCNVVRKQSLLEVNQSFIEVEMGWKPPPEPPCNVSSDCQDWPHTTCKAKRNGKMRCFCRSTFHWDGRNMRCTKVHYLKVVAPCLAGALAIILICGIFFIVHTRNRRLAEPLGSDKIEGIDTEGIDVPFYDWESILAATNNFADANKLGTGGFGSVYMGKLPDGQEIAVKRLSSASVQGVEEFKTEVMVIAKLQHRNLVRLTGYCMKAEEKILVYEYLHNGSLDSCLFDERHYVDLDWKKRFDIILGIARGLLYLHQDSRLRIIHRDLKPSNILLDEELNPKISDFGIARIVGGKDTQASTGRVVGTYGYMSPEYAYEGIFSVKSDVFSFGVVILETISGRRNSKIFMFEHGLSLLGYAWKLWNEDKGLELMDPKLNESCFPSEVQKCIHIGLLCVQEDPSDRPTMSTVVYMLSGENASLPLAKQPAFMNRKPLSDNASPSSAKDLSAHEVMTVSTVGR